jgi:MFS family permease
MVGVERYAAFLREPGMARMLLASIVGRVPIGVATLAILMSVQAHAGSFAQSGIAAASYVFGLAVVAPVLGRLIDRFGPRPVLAVSGIVYPAALGTFLWLLDHSAEASVIAGCAMVAGAALPPVTIAMRALFPRLVSDVALLQTAYSTDSALVEVMFVIGPALVAVFVAAGHPDGGMLLAAGSAALGTALFVRCAAVRNWSGRESGISRRRLGALSVPVLRAILATTLLYSIAFGLFEVAVMAFAAGEGAPAAAGVILALASVGSAAGALCYGSRTWAPALPRQYLLALVSMAGGILVMTPLSNLHGFALLSIAAGVPMATVIAVQSLLISRIAPRDMLAESFTWGATCLLGGISAGIAAGGVMAESLSPHVILAAAAGSTALAAFTAWATVREPH